MNNNFRSVLPQDEDNIPVQKKLFSDKLLYVVVAAVLIIGAGIFITEFRNKSNNTVSTPESKNIVPVQSTACAPVQGKVSSREDFTDSVGSKFCKITLDTGASMYLSGTCSENSSWQIGDAGVSSSCGQ